MNNAESGNIMKDVNECYDKLTEHASKAQLEPFLSYYHDSPDFLSFSADGKLSNYDQFKKACSDYYNAIREQLIVTAQKQVHVVEKDIVIVGWTGDIIATFKNGDIVKMKNYSITSVFKKINNKWKVIHDHESAPPAEIVKKE